MSEVFTAPAMLFEGRTRSSRDTEAIAAAWHAHLSRAIGDAAPLAAIPLANRPDSLALFLALTAGTAAAIVLSEDPRSWRTAPAIPAGTPLVLTPEQGALADAAKVCGLRPEI